MLDKSCIGRRNKLQGILIKVLNFISIEVLKLNILIQVYTNVLFRECWISYVLGEKINYKVFLPKF